jgi:hypothetical protein
MSSARVWTSKAMTVIISLKQVLGIPVMPEKELKRKGGFVTAGMTTVRIVQNVRYGKLLTSHAEDDRVYLLIKKGIWLWLNRDDFALLSS